MKATISFTAWVLLVATTTFLFCNRPAQAQSPAPLPEIAIDRDNIRITKSVRIKPGTYVVADADGNGVLQVAADNVVVDFRGATLVSRKNVRDGDKERYDGVGIAVNGHEKVVIKNATVQGYGFNLKAEGCKELRVEGGNFSYSRGQRISRNGRPIDIFLELRDVNAWRKYGTAVWLENCRQSTVTLCRASGAQNGICLVSSRGCTIHDNDMSFNSGWGIALSSSENNVVSWNHADFCNRPCQRGGGDNAGVAVVNGSHRNFVVGNSMTYGGDGFFLTDGANRGVRPSNDNVIAHNDGSWADAVAFEGTFSERNVYYKNHASDARYGFWLGWAYNNVVTDNTIERHSHDGIAIEYGGFNRIERNKLAAAGNAAIHLWSDDPKKGLSRQYTIIDNDIQNSPTAILLKNTTEYFISNNKLKKAAMPTGLASTLKEAQGKGREAFLATPAAKRLEEIVATKPKDFAFFRDQTKRQGRDLIRHGDFAPVDIRGALGIRARNK